MTLEMESKADTVLQDDSYPKIWPTVRKYVETFDKASMAAVILNYMHFETETVVNEFEITGKQTLKGQ